MSNIRVSCKKETCNRTPLVSVANEKRGYCGNCYPSTYKCADDLPRSDKKGHKKQYPKAYKGEFDSEFVLIIVAALSFIAFKIGLTYVLDTYFPELGFSWSDFGEMLVTLSNFIMSLV